MIRVYTAESLPAVSFVKTLLESEGIACILRNEHLSSGMGELPLIECWPELWILNAHNERRARELVAEFIRDAERDHGPDWTCAKCNEQVEGVFHLCWNCGARRS